MDFTPQQYHEKVEDVKSLIELHTKYLKELLAGFVEVYGTNEYPVMTLEGKEKWFRVYEPEGQFVYNRKHEVGLRAKAESPADPELIKSLKEKDLARKIG